MNKGLIAYIVNVGSLSNVRAEAFCERLKDNLRKQKTEEYWDSIIVPVRGENKTQIQVYSRDEDKVNRIWPLVHEQLESIRIAECRGNESSFGGLDSSK
jgi:hypothetical protein